MDFIQLEDLDLRGKRVLVRVDLNVPMQAGAIVDDARIKSVLPIIQQIISAGGKGMLVSHLGRPVEGAWDPAFSLSPVARRLSELLDRDVPLVRDWVDGTAIPADALLVLFENVRFQTGESCNHEELARKMAALCDIYVNNAFATLHREHASISGVAKYAPVSCVGPLVLSEIKALRQGLTNPDRPLLTIVGGSKISTKLPLLQALARNSDSLVLGGGIANTVLEAQGYAVGCSLVEENSTTLAEALCETAKQHGCHLLLPNDVMCAKEFSRTAVPTSRRLDELAPDDVIMDYGAESIAKTTRLIQEAGTIVWNGPVGVFEFPEFSHGTRTIGEAIAASPAYSIAGGGETVAAINSLGLASGISHISTGGGAFLKTLECFLTEEELPTLTILYESARAWAAMERGREM